MTNEFFEPGTERANKVDQLFTRIARGYDLLNDVQSLGLHRSWKRRLVSMARVGSGASALDVCCGTGDIAFALAREGADVIGLDFNEPMLEVARRRAGAWREQTGAMTRKDAFAATRSRKTPKAPQFVQGDAARLPFAEASFEIVSVGYGLRNLASWETGLSEMCRVAKSGGRLVVLDFGKPPVPLWRSLYFGYLRLFVPLLGLTFCGSASAYAYILESLRHYPAQQGVAAKMRELGLTDIRVVELLGGVMSINYGEKR